MKAHVKQLFRASLLGSLVTCMGCSSLHWGGGLSEDDALGHILESPCAKLKRDLDELKESLLLLPYTKRAQIVALYGEPTSTVTNECRLLVDTYPLPEGLTLRTYFTAQDTTRHDSFQWADVLVKEASLVPPRLSRFEWPEPLQDADAMALKIARLRNLKARLLRECKTIVATETHQTGTLVRTYTTLEHFKYPVGEEVWRRNGKVVARGTYRDYKPWQGSFLLGMLQTELDRFRKVIYENGVLEYSLVPDWEERRNQAEKPLMLKAFAEEARKRELSTSDPDPFAVPDMRFIQVGDPFVSGVRSEPRLDQEAFDTNKDLLNVCQEPVFIKWADESGVAEGYRVVICPSFTPAVIVTLALDSKDRQPSIHWKVTDGAAGYPDTVIKIARQSGRVLSRAEVRELRAIIKKSVFWSNEREFSVGALDGWMLYYEGVKDGRYTYRRYFNSDARASEALAYKVLALIPSEAKQWPRPWCVPITDPYLWNLAECFNDSVRILEHFGQTNAVDDVMFRPDMLNVSRAMLMARSLLSDKLKKENMISDFNALKWSPDGSTLVHTNGSPITVKCEKSVAIWDNSWMFDYTFFSGADTNGVAARGLKLTPSATLAHYKGASASPRPSPVALRILEQWDLSPAHATVVDWGETWGADASDNVERLMVVPAAEFAGAMFYTVSINHTKRKYTMSSHGGISEGGSLCSREFDESW